MSILIVEDNLISLKILDINLRENGYEVVTAPDPKEALELLEAIPKIKLIVTDIMMPEMDGLEFIAKVKANAKWKKLPFIIISAMSNKKTVKKAIALGCQHFIVKPVQSQQLLKMVRNILPHQRLIIRSKSQNAAQMGLDMASYQKICTLFGEMLKKELMVLEKELGKGKYKDFSLNLKQLRESATTLSAERVLDVLDDLDSLASEDGKRSVWNFTKYYELLLEEMKLLHNALTISVDL
ncbi:MAG: two-component system, chemotaxis family, response regulator CheY [Candidatus Magnetoglobus multicellularis str. Araruama]|uniref:Two-component system, chemotaxis family, response regulator CheY n=1 Tax=Candidatus Magnetoglobus multicellularis str. Araruama TaxID=890399 RepID=A0A1V1PFE0_9BACT|nr:MAG: two-component system, chemotaxis family, response regulator CheY [Candidatus Magnetoglobus multicellularis str. Araruama]